MERGRHYIFQLSLQRNPEETKRYVEACFGKSIYSQEYQEKIEQNCVWEIIKIVIFYLQKGIQEQGGMA